MDTTFLDPQVGFLWTWAPGFSIGLDAGLQIRLSSNTSSSIQTGMPAAVQAYATPLQNTLESVAGAAGQTVLPTIDLLRIGMSFWVRCSRVSRGCRPVCVRVGEGRTSWDKTRARRAALLTVL